MSDTKTYSSKSNAARAFRTQFPAHAGLSTSKLVELGYIDDDAPDQWVVNDPDTTAEDEFEAGAAEEARRRKEIADAATAAEEAAVLANYPMAKPEQVVQISNLSLPKSGQEGNCPHCGKSTRGGDNVTEFAEMSPGSQRDTDHQFTCNQCAGEWGPKVDKPKTARAKSGSSNGLKIEKDREARNGVSRPSAGGKCRGIWDELDAMGVDVAAKDARAKLVPQGYDKTTVMVQFYRWRKFNGIEGRQS